jgi:hypothetical protein
MGQRNLSAGASRMGYVRADTGTTLSGQLRSEGDRGEELRGGRAEGGPSGRRPSRAQWRLGLWLALDGLVRSRGCSGARGTCASGGRPALPRCGRAPSHVALHARHVARHAALRLPQPRVDHVCGDRGGLRGGGARAAGVSVERAHRPASPWLAARGQTRGGLASADHSRSCTYCTRGLNSARRQAPPASRATAPARLAPSRTAPSPAPAWPAPCRAARSG